MTDGGHCWEVGFFIKISLFWPFRYCLHPYVKPLSFDIKQKDQTIKFYFYCPFLF